MTPTKILVTCPPMLEAIDAFEDQFSKLRWEVTAPDVVQTLTEAELCELVPAHDGWIIGDDPATRRVMEAGIKGRLRAMVKWGIGTDNVDFQAAEEIGLPVTNTPGVFSAEVADVAIAYLISLARHLTTIDRAVRSGGWPKLQGRSVSAMTVGIVGLGNIGQATVQRVKALGCNVIGYDPYVEAPSSFEVRVWPDGLEELDGIIFTCPLTDETHGMMDAEALDELPDDALVVNVSRGPVIQQEALVQALEENRLGGAALDVFDTEPLPQGHPLTEIENVILGSHNASNTREGVLRATQLAIEQLDAFLEGSAP